MTPHALTRNTLEHAERLALHWLRIMMGTTDPAQETRRLPGADKEFHAIQALFSDAMAQLTPHKRRWLGVASPASTRITENEVHCLDALAASQADDIAAMQRSLRAIFPQAWARVAFFDAFESLGAWLAVRGHWLAREATEAPASPPAPCDRCTACGPQKVTLSSYACLAARSRWRETITEKLDTHTPESVLHR